MHRALPLALAIASTAFVIPLRAEADEGVDVTWSAPDECPSSVELRRRVTSRVPGDASVRARGRVEKRAGRYRVALDIATSSARGERALEASTCDALASSAAVVIAMSVAPEGARETETVAATPATTSMSSATTASATTASTAPAASATSDAAATTPAAARPAPPTTTSSSPAPPPADRPNEAGSRRASESSSRFLLRAHVVGDAGLLPAAAVGGGLAFGVVVVRDLSVEASADVFGSQDGTVAGTPGRGASFSLFSAGARACYTLTHGIEVAPCLGAEVARISASGFGAARVSDAAAVTWGPEALLTGRIPIAGPVAARVGIGAFVPMSRQSFVINAAGTVHEPEAIALRTWAGPEVRF